MTSAVPPRSRAELKRVAFLIGQLGLGGAERQPSLLTLELHRRGVGVHVLLLAKGGPHEAALRDAGVRVHHLGFTRSGPLPPVRNVLASCRMVRLLRRVRPEVLHAYLPESYPLGVPAACLARVPVVIAGRRGLSRFNKARRPLFTVGTAVTRLADHVVANAAAVAEDTRRVEGIPAHKITVIYNGLARSAFDRVDPEPLGTGLPVVLCVARLVPEKGLALLVDAAAILEAMAAGQPVVAPDVGGAAELLDDRCILVPPEDPVALGDGILQVLDDPELPAEIGTTARAWARKNLDLDVMADDHLALYRRLLDERCGG